jgi:hypothetical protein
MFQTCWCAVLSSSFPLLHPFIMFLQVKDLHLIWMCLSTASGLVGEEAAMHLAMLMRLQTCLESYEGVTAFWFILGSIVMHLDCGEDGGSRTVQFFMREAHRWLREEMDRARAAGRTSYTLGDLLMVRWTHSFGPVLCPFRSFLSFSIPYVRILLSLRSWSLSIIIQSSSSCS